MCAHARGMQPCTRVSHAPRTPRPQLSVRQIWGCQPSGCAATVNQGCAFNTFRPGLRTHDPVQKETKVFDEGPKLTELGTRRWLGLIKQSEDMSNLGKSPRNGRISNTRSDITKGTCPVPRSKRGCLRLTTCPSTRVPSRQDA